MADITTLGAPIKTAYEGQANTNAFTDAEKTKLAGVPSSFDADTVGLGNVDNTSDADKPISDDTQAALDLKQPISPRVSSSASSATPTPNADTTDAYILTALAAAAAFAAPTGTPVQGQAMIIRIKDNGTARALTWDAIYRAIGVTLPTTTVISKTTYISMIYNSTDTKWDVLGVALEA